MIFITMILICILGPIYFREHFINPYFVNMQVGFDGNALFGNE